MHEWALAEAIISTISQIAEREGLKEVIEVRIKIGELQQIEPDVLRFALSQIRTSIFEKTRLEIEIAKAWFKCGNCGNKWIFDKETLDDENADAIHFIPEVVKAYVKCPKCGSMDLEILHGRGVWLEGVKGVK